MKRFWMSIMTLFMMAMVMSGCSSSVNVKQDNNGTVQQDDNGTQEQQDDNGTVQQDDNGTVVIELNSSLTIQLSDLPSGCSDGVQRVQVWTQKNYYNGGGSLMGQKLVDVWEFGENNITKNDTNFSIELPKHIKINKFGFRDFLTQEELQDDAINDPIRVNATAYCYDRVSQWGDGDKIISYIWTTGNDTFVKNPFALTMVFAQVRWEKEDWETEDKWYHTVPSEVAPEYWDNRLIMGVESSLELISDYPATETTNVDMVGRISGGTSYWNGDYYQEGSYYNQNNEYYQNLQTDMYHFSYNGNNGYIDAGAGNNVFDRDVKFVIPWIKTTDGQTVYGDLMWNPDFKNDGKNPVVMDVGIDQQPDWMHH